MLHNLLHFFSPFQGSVSAKVSFSCEFSSHVIPAQACAVEWDLWLRHRLFATSSASYYSLTPVVIADLIRNLLHSRTMPAWDLWLRHFCA